MLPNKWLAAESVSERRNTMQQNISTPPRDFCEILRPIRHNEQKFRGDQPVNYTAASNCCGMASKYKAEASMVGTRVLQVKGVAPKVEASARNVKGMALKVGGMALNFGAEAWKEEGTALKVGGKALRVEGMIKMHF